MNVVPVISVRIDEGLKRRMEKFAHVNWSEVLRKAVADRVALEERLAARRRLDVDRLLKAVKDQDRLRSKTTGRWSGAEEVRKWRGLKR